MAGFLQHFHTQLNVNEGIWEPVYTPLFISCRLSKALRQSPKTKPQAVLLIKHHWDDVIFIHSLTSERCYT